MSNIIDSIQLSGVTYTLQGSGGGTVSSAITSGDTNAVAGGAVYNKFDEVEQVTARALNDLDEKINPTVELTQAQYDALVSAGTVSADTYYIISDATAFDPTTKVDTSAFTAYSAATNTALNNKVDTSAITSSVTSASTDSEIPTAKAVYDAIPTGGTSGGKAISAGTNISVTTGETADTINCTLNAKNGTGNYSFIGNGIIGGIMNSAPGVYATAFGISNKANARASFVIGGSNYGNGEYSFVGGSNSEAIGNNSFAFGYMAKAVGQYSIAFGSYFPLANNTAEVAIGKANVSHTGSTDADKTLFSVGNGTNSSNRHNAFEIRQNGDIYLSSGGTDIKLQDHLGGSSITVDTALDSGSTNPVENRVIYNKIDEIEQVTARALNELNDNFGGLKLVKLTQAEYNALATKDSSTLYIIVN